MSFYTLDNYYRLLLLFMLVPENIIPESSEHHQNQYTRSCVYYTKELYLSYRSIGNDCLQTISLNKRKKKTKNPNFYSFVHIYLLISTTPQHRYGGQDLMLLFSVFFLYSLIFYLLENLLKRWYMYHLRYNLASFPIISFCYRFTRSQLNNY